MGSLALTGKPQMREAFEPMPSGVEHIDSTIEALEASIDDRVAALFVEPIKGEAGVIDLPDGFLRRARELTEKHGVLLIIDEIQTGVGRTGKWFAYEHAGIVPEQAEILELASVLKRDRFSTRPLAGPQTVAVIFDKSSTRTLVSFAVGIADLGGSPLIISTANSQLGGKESPTDTARVLERQVAAIVWRTYAQSGLEQMALGTTVPVVNALSDDFHPCQLLADLLTIREHKGTLAGLTVTFLGDGASNMAQSYLLAGATAGMHVRVAAPEEFSAADDVVADADARASQRRFGRAVHRPERGGRRRGCRGHRHLGVDGQGGREGSSRRDLRRLSGHHRADGPGEARRPVPALPARRPRIRGDRRGHRRPAERDLG